MNSPHRLVLAVACALALASVSSGKSDALTGVWAGPARHAGTKGEIVLRMEAMGDTALAVRLSLPAIDVWELPLGSAALDGDTLRLGWWDIHYDRERGTLDGVLPAALVPVYRIPFELARVDSIPRAISAEEEAPAVEPLWAIETGAAVWAGVAATNECVYAGNDDGVLRAVRAQDGEPVWRFECGGPIRARPVVDSGAVFVCSDDGNLYKLDASSGSEIWRARLLDGARERIPPGQQGSRYDHYASSAEVVGDVVYIGAADGSVYALDADTGEPRWRFQADDVVASTPAVAGGRVIAGSFDGHIYALDPKAGDALWRFDTGAPVVSSPAVSDGLVLVGSRSYDLFAFDAESLSVAWTFYVWFSWVESSATLRDGVAYVGSSDAQRLFAIDAKSGALQWSTDTGGSVWAQPAVNGEAVFIGSVGVADYMVDHRGAFMAVERSTGECRWRYPVEPSDGSNLWGFASSPAAMDDAVFVGGLDGKLYAFPSRAVE